MKTLGERVKHLRGIRQLTQKELSEKTGITKATIVRIERGCSRINSDIIIVLANFFLVTTDWLLLGSKENETQPIHSEEIAKQMQEAFDVMKGLQGEPLRRIMEYILYEYSNNSSTVRHHMLYDGFAEPQH